VTGIKYNIAFEGQAVPMCGIGGVATLPEYRRQGAIRAIMDRLLHQEREEGTVFSYLYPFSFQFYAKFGYGPGCRRFRVELPAGDLCTLPGRGQIRHYRPEDRPVVESIYARFTAGTNGPVRRTKGLWDRLLEQDRWQEQQHVYISGSKNPGGKKPTPCSRPSPKAARTPCAFKTGRSPVRPD
jgi:predicted acetyltransferase